MINFQNTNVSTSDLLLTHPTISKHCCNLTKHYLLQQVPFKLFSEISGDFRRTSRPFEASRENQGAWLSKSALTLKRSLQWLPAACTARARDRQSCANRFLTTEVILPSNGSRGVRFSLQSGSRLHSVEQRKRNNRGWRFLRHQQDNSTLIHTSTGLREPCFKQEAIDAKAKKFPCGFNYNLGALWLPPA